MKLEIAYETENQEFKKTLAELDKGILSLSAMLNKTGKGKVYFGIDNNGNIIGLKSSIGQETIKKIRTRIAELIKPIVIPKITLESYDEKFIILIEAEGYNKPYSCSGEYRIRVGSENKKIDPSIISELVLSNSITQMENVESINQDLDFEQLKSLYRSHKLTINDKTFYKNTNLLTKNGKFNYLADILADDNNCSIKVVRFNGKDKLEMISRNEFGYKCLLISMKAAYDFVSSLNEVRVDLTTGMERKEYSLFDLNCFDEAWTNACLHNKWIKNVSPAIYIFDDRIEIVSTGGLPYDFSKSEFFAGTSRPVNIGLQKVMGQLNYIEQTGHGVPKIVATYGKEAFNIGENHITVTIPFAFEPSFKQINTNNLSLSQKKVFTTIKNNPTITIAQLSTQVGLGTTRVATIIKELKDLGKIKRIGKTKGGYWEIS